MSVADEPVDLTTLKTREQVVAHYRERPPLVGAYLDVVDEHQGPPCSINEPWTGGIDERAAARLALARIGRPARDDTDVAHALAHIREIQSEMATLYPPTDPTIQSYVIGEFFQYAGCVPTAEDWLDDGEYPDSERGGYLFNIVEAIPAGDLPALLQECLRHAMPSILRKITADDAARRAPRIREADIAVVRERVRLVAVVSGYVVLDGSGDVLTGLCPFDDEDTRTFSVDTSRDLYHCTRCGEGGDVIALVMKMQQVGFVEAVQWLAARYSIELGREDGGRE